jgi:hypothetical protein
MYKLLGGANIFLKHQIVVYSKNITASTMGRGYFFCSNTWATMINLSCVKRGLLAYLSALILGFLS